jgi:DNA-entry nuclease
MKRTNFLALYALLLSVVIALTGCVAVNPETIESEPSYDSSPAVSDGVSSENCSENESKNTLESTEDSSSLTSSDISDDESASSGNNSDSNQNNSNSNQDDLKPTDPLRFIDVNNLPVYDGSPFVALNDNEPAFSKAEITDKAFESYAKLDSLGRCGTTFACVGKETMPTEPRGDISSVKPSGWNNVKYDTSLVDGGYIYNRCHLLGFQLTGENANKYNLITGTRYMNVDGMLPFENMVADYVKETGNHVLLRVTPVFVGNELVARGVVMEAYSVEDEGDGVFYNVYCFNVQPGIDIDYSDGTSKLADGGNDDTGDNETKITYILNTSTKKFHYPNCASAKKIADKNRAETTKSREELIAEGYSPCGNCDP